MRYDPEQQGCDEYIKALEERLEYSNRMAEMAGRLAISLECMCLDPTQGYNEAIQRVSEWHDMINEVNPMPPTFMGEPL